MKDLRCKKCNKLLRRYRDCGELKSNVLVADQSTVYQWYSYRQAQDCEKEERAVTTARSTAMG